MKLHTLKPAKGAVKSDKRIGRGQGSGKGGTSTKGNKGQQSRGGFKFKYWFEGGQMPLQRRVPKFGFKNPFRVEYKAINLDTIQELVESTGEKRVDHALLVSHGLISKSNSLVKVLGRGEVKTGVEVVLNKFSQSAKAAIEAAGGSATEI